MATTYKVTYKGNGGTCTITDATAYSSGKIVTVKFTPAPTYSGYTFLGWSTSTTATIPKFSVTGTTTFVIKANTTLYAIWVGGATYSVTYDGNGGETNITDNNSYTSGDTVTVQFSPTPTRLYSAFLGWATNPSATVPTYTVDGATYFKITSTTTLYAVWLGYSVTYDGNGGTTAITDSNSYQSGDSVTVQFTPTPTRSGYVFLGWSTTDTATTPTYAVGGTTSLTIPIA